MTIGAILKERRNLQLQINRYTGNIRSSAQTGARNLHTRLTIQVKNTQAISVKVTVTSLSHEWTAPIMGDLARFD